MKRRVVITGLGVVSPIGNDKDELWNSIKTQKCGIDEITLFDTSEHKVKLAGEVKNLDFEKYYTKRELKFNDRFTQFARIATKQAYIDSDIHNVNNLDKDRMGVVLSSGIGGIETISNSENVLKEKGASRVSPYFIPMALINIAAGTVAIDLGAKGYCSSVVTACASSTNAIGEGFLKIRDGYLDIAFVGGSEASITPLAISGFASMRALSESKDKNRASIPFDKERNGFVMGEGSAVLVIEELEHALKRKAKIYAEIVGYGNSCDANHITAPLSDGSGASKAMQNAMNDALITPKQIEYINAHGTGTLLNDRGETLAIKTAFGDYYKDVLVSSTKSSTGHLLGAGGAIEALITVLSIKHSYIPATINFKEVDEECDLNIVKNKGIQKNINYAMSNSLGFGGHNASLIFKKWE
ncbi:MAG: beta-ketoacyl-ACP synthase II [Peptoniphilaceae bacterium]|uniref:beta-ketoacyl-ACP synthase II n=1 Tax=Parvimonas sp. TaxID=1944660 RepID=UPI0025CBB3F8|nr:beta-ketoacyl-ACP synthase II [Parvimonas sp.]MCI5997180.1 beta-ketoacyl-ACP synthase II [Parvimonas sp.]MDD7764273.1 beta-ketoacyl-ACP synthase II [Peptoniphilaceae bacterium]MDY3051536.1 beta-ketoacyl-ACP synthase II [Parvimonas sp.]